jgi:hypothetical protein
MEKFVSEFLLSEDQRKELEEALSWVGGSRHRVWTEGHKTFLAPGFPLGTSLSFLELTFADNWLATATGSLQAHFSPCVPDRQLVG